MEARARVRVFVPTYRRRHLLERALISLRAQTCPDWVCEVHNDDPADKSPAGVVARLADPRIHLVTHDRNLGALATFNLAFRATPEPYYSLLEDDNWWEPRFLEVLLAALERHPSITVAWCNQRIWCENADGLWSDTLSLVLPAESGPPRRIDWGQPRQALGALHANGSMLVRSRAGEAFPVPDVPFSGVEGARERQLPHPLLYVPEPLAIYAVTRITARADDRTDWLAFQTVMLATFVRHARMDDDGRAALWTYYRRHSPAPTNVFLCAALICGECRSLLHLARPSDWLRLLRSAVGHPLAVWRALRVRQHHSEWWTVLDHHTAARFAASDRAGSTRGSARPAITP